MERETHIIDLTNKILGRIAVDIAKLLRGKHKPDFTRREDKGDFVVVKNLDKIKVTGKKFKDKKYYHYSGYMGGLKEEPFYKVFEKDPVRILKAAVFGMMPKNKLSRKQIKRLKVER